ncbi:MAG: thioredoxin domain-containing protein [Cyclobacteriaceae bacterium]
MSDHKYTNRLSKETSPYLLQHAHNPVDWYPWGEEALKKAKKEDKPIIVSIGYSSCHWCHVMERESFENDEIGKFMNAHFVCIKVDREERPDVDQIYMEAVQSMGTQGGWPLNVFLMPDQKPFYGGTYYPPAQWVKLLQNVQQAFADQRDKLQESADQFALNLNHSDIQRYGIVQDEKTAASKNFDEKLLKIYQKFSSNFDPEWGAMNRAPKFPMPANWLFLLRLHFYARDEQMKQQSRQHLELTLDRMAQGGIYDQVGGGFARYSVDERWFAPHFEKMLYDNGQLLSLYAEAFQLTKKPLYRSVMEDTIGFLKREMSNPEGGFFSALDADSEGHEGKFYVWTADELREVLGETAELMMGYYNATEEGNWEKNWNILHRLEPDDAFAQKYELGSQELKEVVAESRRKLLEVRAQRVRPGLDDKILASWNGLMLKGLTDAYAALQQTEILELALRNAHFIADKLMRKQGNKASLYRSYKDGKASFDAYLEDYAFVIDAYVALYQLTFDERWLAYAQQLTAYVMDHFYDPEEGFFFYTSTDSELIARKKELFDNVIPGSNSAMARNLYKLGLLLDESSYLEIAEQMLGKMTKLLETDPAYLSNWGSLYCEAGKPTAEVAIIGEKAREMSKPFLSLFYPNKLVLGTEKSSELPLLSERKALDEETTIYVCFDKSCQLPVKTVEEAMKQLMSSV